MALFNKAKERPEEAALDLVLAHLEDLQRTRGAVLLLDAKAREFNGVLAKVDEEARSCTVAIQGRPAGLAKGDPASLVFLADGVRLRAASRIQELGGASVTLELPKALELHERRKAVRARLNPKEGASVSALSGLFEGIGLVGPIENLTGSGARIRIDKAMEIKGERKLPVGEAIVQPGHAFMLVKINHVPKCPPVMETEGSAVYVDAKGGAVCLGIRFGRPYPAAARFAEERAGTLPTTVPPKARRKPRSEEDPQEAPAVQAKEPPPPPTPPVPAERPAAPAPAAGGTASAPPAARPPVSPVLRLKKRARPVVVFAEGEQAQRLAGLLAADGYGRVLVAGDFGEAQAALLQPNVALLFLDMGASLLECLQFLAELREGQVATPPILLAAEEVSRALALAAQRAGVARILVKPYALDEDLLAVLDRVLEA